MTEEEYFRKNYPDSCYGDKPLSPYWDFFQDGVEFGERQSEKRIEDLKDALEKLKSVAEFQQSSNMRRHFEIKELEKENRLLGERCKQLLKDKGDLTDQIADIKANCDLAIEGRDVKIMELEEKNTELEKESNRLFLEGAKRVEELEKENAELKEKREQDCDSSQYEGFNCSEKERLKQLTKAKEIIRQFLNDYPVITKEVLDKLEQFIKEIEK